MTKAKQLEQIRADIVDNNVCRNLAQSAKQLVFGDGDPDADILFIGEAPGAKEDETGLPFVGASGKFLQEMLETIGLSRAEVYITNIVKYRPPKNRDPSKKEKQEFVNYLYKQIAVIHPKLIVPLGRHSMSAFLPEEKIGDAHGQLFDKEGLKIMPLYHPAAALYNGSLRKTLIEDFSHITDVLNN